MNRTKIDWRNPAEGWKLDYTWNPVIGCKHGCEWCYARRMNNRFKWIPDWENPQFFEERIYEPADVYKPSTIFVVSMGDLFGDWVPSRWIEQVIEVCRLLPRHRFMFLTKRPKNYMFYEFPNNCWLGTTVLGDMTMVRARQLILHNTNNKKFVSVEPILGPIVDEFEDIDLVIVGAMTGPGAVVPKKEWIESIKHHNVYHKKNIREYL